MKIYNENNIRADYRSLTLKLIEKGKTITTMESATSGQLASLITDTEGASAIFKGALISYSNEVKISFGVPASVIEEFSVYSKETAREMAKTCKATLCADIGIGVTGTTGNIDPANPDSSEPGCVYFAIATESGVQAFFVRIEPQPTRLAYKLAVAKEIYDRLIEII